MLVSTFPANGATGVAIDTEVVFTFDELVGSYWRFHGGYAGYSGVEAYSGLTLHLASDGSVVDNTGFPDDGIAQISPSVLHWVDVMTGYSCGPPHSWLGCAADGHIVSADNNNVVSGCCAYLRAGNPVSWDLSGQQNSGVLMPGTTYYINMTATALADASGNAFPGISGSTAFTFTTEGSSSGTDIPVLAAPTVSSVTATSVTLTLPSKPSGYDDYGSILGYAVFTSSGTPGSWCDACVVSNSWDYNGNQWGTSATSASSLTGGTTYYVRDRKSVV